MHGRACGQLVQKVLVIGTSQSALLLLLHRMICYICSVRQALSVMAIRSGFSPGMHESSRARNKCYFALKIIGGRIAIDLGFGLLSWQGWVDTFERQHANLLLLFEQCGCIFCFFENAESSIQNSLSVACDVWKHICQFRNETLPGKRICHFKIETLLSCSLVLKTTKRTHMFKMKVLRKLSYISAFI
jgi:hypothetical protein